MSSSHKKTQKKKRPILPNSRNAIRKVDDDDYVQLDVPGDGNCFYYAIYGAAKYHADPSIYGKLLTCFDIENKPSLTIREFAKKVRVKLAQEIQKEQGIMEAQEAVAVEQGQLEYGVQRNANLYTMLYEASKRIWAPTETIEYRELERMLQVSTNALEEAKARYMSAEKGTAARRAASKDVAKFLKEIRKGKQNLRDVLNEDTRKFQWEAIKEELSRQITTHPLLGNARAYETMTKQQFKDAFVKLLAGNNLDGVSNMYASQPDVELIDFFLSRCGTPLRIISVLNPERVRIVDSRNGVPILYVRLLKDEGFDHYNFYARGDKFKENFEILKREAIRVKKQHVAKGNTPETPESVASNSSSSNKSSASSSSSNSSSNGLSSLSSASSNTNSNSSTRKSKKSSSLSPASSNTNSNSNSLTRKAKKSSSLSPASSNTNSNSSTRKSKKSSSTTRKAKKLPSSEKTKQFALLEQMRKKKALETATAAAPTVALAKGSMNNLIQQTKPAIVVDPRKPYQHAVNLLAQYNREEAEKRKLNSERPKPSAPPASPPRLPALKATTNVSEFNNLNSLSPNSNNSFSPNTLAAQVAAINAATKEKEKAETHKKPIEGLPLSPRTKAQYELIINPQPASKPSAPAVSATQKSLIAGLKGLLTGKKTQKNKK